MSIAPLSAALDALRFALFEIEVACSDERITIELEYEAGHRFQLWCTLNRACDAWDFRSIDSHTDQPKREVTIRGVRIRWPLKQIALWDGRIIPEPVPDEVVAIRPGPDGNVVSLKSGRVFTTGRKP